LASRVVIKCVSYTVNLFFINTYHFTHNFHTTPHTVNATAYRCWVHFV